MSRHGKGAQDPDVIPGAVVRHLVERSEREIDVLRQQLEAARRQADDDEARVAGLPGALPPPRRAGGPTEGAGSTARPRTTVVSRPRSSGGTRGPAASASPGSADDRRSGEAPGPDPDGSPPGS